MSNADSHDLKAEYVIVGSGAGGGTLAARLAEYGYSVLLLEAGTDPKKVVEPEPRGVSGGLPNDYDVPVFHGYSSENKAIAWDFFVRHYADDQLQKKDPNYIENVDGRRVDGVDRKSVV